MIRRKLLAAATGLATIGVLVAVWIGMRDAPREAVSIHGPDARSAAPPALSRAAVDAMAPAGRADDVRSPGTASPPAESPRLVDSPRQRFQKASDLRIFVEQAKRSVEPGAALYATRALMECSGVREVYLTPDRVAVLRREISAEPGQRQAERTAALETALSRCASFSLDELSPIEGGRVAGWLASSDPWLAVYRRIIRASSTDRDGRLALLGETVAIGDPYLLSSAAGLMSEPTSDGSGVVGYVDGMAFGGLDAEAYLAARSLAICRFTSTCMRAENVDLLHECAIAGNCIASLDESIRLDPRLKDRAGPIEALAALIVERLKAGNLDALMPPKAPR